MPRVPCLLLAATLALAGATPRADDNVLVDLARVRFAPVPGNHPGEPPATAATVTRTATGSLRFAGRGPARTRLRWEAPLPGALPVDGRVEVGAHTVNVTTRPQQPNLSLALAPRTPAPNVPDVAVPLFTAVGREHREWRATEFATAGGTLVPRTLSVELVLDEAGEASLELTALQLTFAGNLLPEAELTRLLAQPAGLATALRFATPGLPGLTVNGRPLDTWGVAAPLPAALTPATLATLGLHLRLVPAPLGGPDSLWSYPTYFDRDRLAAALRQACLGPDDYVILDVHVDRAPAWWPGGGAASGRADDTDPAWRAYVEAALRHLLAALRQEACPRRVIGLTLTLGPQRNLTALPGREDSPGYANAFRAWLTAKYPTDEALRTAWAAPAARLTTAAPVPRAQWPGGALGPLFPPRTAPATRDSYAFACESWTRYLLATAELVKRLSHNELLCGVPNGPATFLNELWNPQHQLSPGGLRLLLAAPAVDYVELDLDTTDRRLALGTTGNERLLADLLRARHKLLVLRRTARLAPDATDAAALGAARQWLRREFVNALAGPAALLFAPPDPEHFALPWVQAEFQRAADLRVRLATRPPAAAPTLAFAVDPDLFADCGPEASAPRVSPAELAAAADPHRVSPAPAAAWHLLGVPRLYWPRAGVPDTVVSVDELTPASGRVVVLYHVLRLNPERRRRIEALTRERRTVVWLWADGLVGDGEFSPRLSADLTGLGLQLRPAPGRLFLSAEPALGDFLGLTQLANHFGAPVGALAPEAAGALTFAPRFTLAPSALADPATVLLARYADGAEPAMAARPQAAGTVVYSATPVLNPEVLRGLARRSGAPIYCEDNHQLYFLPGAIALHAATSGETTLRLPAKLPLLEVFAGRDFRAAREHRLTVEAGTTYLFFLGDRAAWDALAPPPPRP